MKNEQDKYIGTRQGIYDIIELMPYKSKDGHKIYKAKCSICGSFIESQARVLAATVICRHSPEKLKQMQLNIWLAEQHKCEHCGRVMTEKFGSGHFCSRACANSREFSEETKQKKSVAIKGTIAYSNGKEVRFFKESDKIPDGFIKGNFNSAKNFDSFAEFALNKEAKSAGEAVAASSRDRSKDYYFSICKPLIDTHNKAVLDEYEKLLAKKAVGKYFAVQNASIFAKYLSIIDLDHPRQQQGRVFVHILLAERLLDRYLTKKEIVHHKDLDKLHNTFDNIYVFNNKASHARFHMSNCYWLTIDNDVLICNALSKAELKAMAMEVQSNN